MFCGAVLLLAAAMPREAERVETQASHIPRAEANVSA